MFFQGFCIKHLGWVFFPFSSEYQMALRSHYCLQLRLFCRIFLYKHLKEVAHHNSCNNIFSSNTHFFSLMWLFCYSLSAEIYYPATFLLSLDELMRLTLHSNFTVLLKSYSMTSEGIWAGHEVNLTTGAYGTHGLGKGHRTEYQQDKCEEEATARSTKRQKLLLLLKVIFLF